MPKQEYGKQIESFFYNKTFVSEKKKKISDKNAYLVSTMVGYFIGVLSTMYSYRRFIMLQPPNLTGTSKLKKKIRFLATWEPQAMRNSVRKEAFSLPFFTLFYMA